MEDSLKKRYIIKLLANIVNGLINIVLVAIVPKALGPVAFGQFSYLQQFFSQLIAFLDAGTSTAFFTKLSSKSHRKELITFYFLFSTALLVVLLVFLYVTNILNYLDDLLPDIPKEYVVYGALFSFFTWITQVYIKISDSHALTVSAESIKILHKVMSLFLLLYMVNFLPFDLNIYFYFQFISLLSFLMILTILFVKKNIFTKEILRLRLAYTSIIKEFLSFSSPLFIFNTVAIAIGLFDIWLLQKMSGSVQTGFYGLAYSIAAMCFLFTSAMTPIITREFSQSFADDDIQRIKDLFKRYIPMLYAVSAYFSVFIAFESQNLLMLFTDEKFKGAYLVLIVMAFYPMHQTYGQLSGSLFFAAGTTKQYRNIGLTSALIGLVFSYLFIYHFELGAVGFAWKMILAQIIGVNIQLYFNTRLLKIKLLPFIFHQVYTVGIFVVMAYISTHLIYHIESVLFDFLLDGFIYTLLIILVTILYPSIFSVNKIELFSFLNSLRGRISGK
ncbi:oligosaccharide flippase family protein [bacterium]|nr:oligosaccharide flippase family protein [bacterium]MBU1883801.1 oligosaccharide flippase family protein [bacterium]